jgi:hypothetical protein
MNGTVGASISSPTSSTRLPPNFQHLPFSATMRTALPYPPPHPRTSATTRYDGVYARLTRPIFCRRCFRIRPHRLPLRLCGRRERLRHQRSLHRRDPALERGTVFNRIARPSGRVRTAGPSGANLHGKAARSGNSATTSRPRGLRRARNRISSPISNDLGRRFRQPYGSIRSNI